MVAFKWEVTMILCHLQSMFCSFYISHRTLIYAYDCDLSIPMLSFRRKVATIFGHLQWLVYRFFAPKYIWINMIYCILLLLMTALTSLILSTPKQIKSRSYFNVAHWCHRFVVCSILSWTSILFMLFSNVIF